MDTNQQLLNAYLAGRTPRKAYYLYGILGSLSVIGSIIIGIFTLTKWEFIAFGEYMLIAVPVFAILAWFFGIRPLRDQRRTAKALQAGRFRQVNALCRDIQVTEQSPCGTAKEPFAKLTFADQEQEYTLEKWGQLPEISADTAYVLIFLEGSERIDMIYCPQQDKMLYIAI